VVVLKVSWCGIWLILRRGVVALEAGGGTDFSATAQPPRGLLKLRGLRTGGQVGVDDELVPLGVREVGHRLGAPGVFSTAIQPPYISTKG
jgi:hypothetical protein